MNLWDPYHPVTYFLHTLLGTAGVFAALGALAAVKGSLSHIRAGRVFAATATVAAITALVFSATSLSPFAIASSFIVLSLVTSAMLALRPRTRWGTFGEFSAVGMMLVPAVGLLVMAAFPLLDGAPFSVWAWPLAYAFFPIWFLIKDFQFLRLRGSERHSRRLSRHLSRMAFAFAIAVHAPVVTFGDAWGIDPVVAFFGPFLVWPIIVLTTRGTVRRTAVTSG